MGRPDSFPSVNVTFDGVSFFSSRNYTTEPPLYYQGMSVHTLNSPLPVYFSPSNAGQNNTHSVNPLNEFRVACLTQAVPDAFNESALPVIPESILDEYVPWNSGNEPVDDASLSISSSSLCNRSCFSENEPDIREPSLANLLNLNHHLTNLPVELAYQQDSRPVAVVNPLNLQQATSDNPANSTDIVNDSRVERRRERQRERQRERYKNPASLERERERQRERRKNPAFRERERERQREYRKNPAVQERERERQRKRRKNPAFVERQRERGRKRYLDDPIYAERQRENNKKRYENDPAFAKRKRERRRKLLKAQKEAQQEVKEGSAT